MAHNVGGIYPCPAQPELTRRCVIQRVRVFCLPLLLVSACARQLPSADEPLSSQGGDQGTSGSAAVDSGGNEPGGTDGIQALSCTSAAAETGDDANTESELELCERTPDCIAVTYATSGCEFSSVLSGCSRLPSEEEWNAFLNQTVAEHAIDTGDFPACGEPISQDYRAPVWQSALGHSPTYDFDDNPTRCLDLSRACTRHEDCMERSGGRCRGFANATCAYPRQFGEPCSSDASCTVSPDGRCVTPGDRDAACYPTGRCDLAVPRCEYAVWEECSSDADCTSLPDGSCRKRVDFSRCMYDDCNTDSDCPNDQRCTCSEFTQVRVCVKATCWADHDCGSGQVCRLATGCFDAPFGYFCSTPQDSCESQGECGPSEQCQFVDGRWQCLLVECPSID